MKFKKHMCFRCIDIFSPYFLLYLSFAFVYDSYKEKQGIKILNEIGAEYHYDTEMYSGGRGWRFEPPELPILLKYFHIIRHHYFANVITVYLPQINFKEHDLNALSNLHQIELMSLDGSKSVDKIMPIAGKFRLWYLSLKKTDTTDEGLIYLINQNDLEYLYLDDTLITDKGLSLIAKLKKLNWLGVARCGLTDEGYEILGKMTQLELIRLGGNKNSAQGWQYIENLSELACLIIQDSVLDKEAIDSLAKLKNLKGLDLYNVDIKNEGILHMENLKQITELSIYNMSFTDADLRHLIKLKELVEITLYKTRVTKEAIKDFKNQKPDVDIIFEGHTVLENGEIFQN